MWFCGTRRRQVGPPQTYLIAERSVIRVPGAKPVSIVGDRFGGLAATLRLSREHSLQVLFVAQRDHHLFQPSPDQAANHG